MIPVSTHVLQVNSIQEPHICYGKKKQNETNQKPLRRPKKAKQPTRQFAC